jgi:hypothetical protein
MKPAKIKKYAADLANGLWGLTGDTIKFGTDGMLKDGQNRLSACLRVGKPMISHVVFGIDPQLFARMDIGKNRTGGDVFAIAGISYAGHVAATVRWLLILTGPDPSDRGAQFSNEDLLKAYREQFDADKLERSIQSALAVRKTCHHPVGPLRRCSTCSQNVTRNAPTNSLTNGRAGERKRPVHRRGICKRPSSRSPRAATIVFTRTFATP